MNRIKAVAASAVVILLIYILGHGCYENGERLLLVDAAQRGDLALVQRLLRSGVSPDSDDDGTPALVAATRAGGHIEAMKALLGKGASVDARGVNGYTPLLCAATTDVEKVRLLLRYGADVNAADADGHTALMIASENAEADIVQVLLLNGARVNAKDATGQTALMKVASIQYDVPVPDMVATAKALTLYGANAADNDGSGKTPLSMAVENKHTQLKAILKDAGARK